MGASRPVVTQAVEAAPTLASPGCERQRQTQSPEQQDSELLVGSTKSGPVGRTVSAQLAPAPLCDSSSARDAESNSAKSTSNTRLSTAAPALRCHPRLTFGDGSSSPAKGPASAPSTRAAHVGVWKPWRRRDSAACSASRALGGVLGTDRSVKGRTRLAGARVAFPQGADNVPGCPVRCMTVLPCGA